MTVTSKSKLEQLSREQESELEMELDELVDKGKSLATTTVIIAGGLALTYLIYKSLFDEGKPKKKKKKRVVVEDGDEVIIEEESSIFGEITGTIAKEASIFLLEIAKQKLAEYLSARDEPAPATSGKK